MYAGYHKNKAFFTFYLSIIALWLYLSTGMAATQCDVDQNGYVEYNDIVIIKNNSGQQAKGPDDPRDADGNGRITTNDLKICQEKCTFEDCGKGEVKPPKAVKDTANTVKNQPITINLTANDRGRGERIDARTVRIVKQSERGTVVNNKNGTVTYRPQTDYIGTDRFKYQVKDKEGNLSNKANVSITINELNINGGGTNLPPIANAGADRNVPTGQAVILDGSQSSDPEKATLTYAWVLQSKPAASTLTVAGVANSQTVAPNFTPDVDGVYELALTVSDGVNTNADTVVITAATANVPPNVDAGPDRNALIGATFDLLNPLNPILPSAIDTDAGPSALTLAWTFVTLPVGSTAVISNANTLTPSFTPDLAGVYTLRLTANDGLATTTDDITINADVNSAPNANAGVDFAVPLGSAANINGSGDDPDGLPSPLTFQWTFVSLPIGSGLNNGSITTTILTPTTTTASFTPDILGLYTLSLDVFDGALHSIIPANITVKANVAPVADNDSFTTTVNTPLVQPEPGVLDGDIDPNIDPLIAELDTPPTLPANGTLTVNSNGSFTYTPNTGFTGQDTFTYRANDQSTDANGAPIANALSNVATVTINVTPPNTPPILTASGATPSFTEDGGAVAIDSGITVADTDDTNLESAIITITNPQDGASEVLAASVCAGLTVTPGLNSLSIAGSQPIAAYQSCLRSITYNNSSQNPGIVARSIAFIVNDGSVNSNTATVTLTVNGVNDAPVINSAPGNATEDTLFTYNATRTDVDSTGQLWNVVVGTDTCPGSSINPATGIYSFTPTGPVPPANCRVAIQVCDGGTPDQCSTQSVDISIAAVNDSPTINSTASTTATEDTPYTYNATRLDLDGPGQIWSLAGSHTCGGTVVPGTGAFTFTPAGPIPPASCVVDLQVCDTGAPNLCATQSTTVTITAVNDAPVARSPAPSYTGNANLNFVMADDGGDGAGGILDLLDGATDPDGTAVSITAATIATANGGSVTVNTDGSFSYQPAPGFVGNDTFTYQIRDSGTPLPAETADITATISVSDLDGAGSGTSVLWFIDEDNTASSSIGTQANPFRSLAAFNAVNTGVGNNPADTDVIFMNDDSGVDNNGDGAGVYGGGITLRANQRLVGDGSSSTLAAITGVTLGSFNSLIPFSGIDPTIAGGITLNSGNTLRGVIGGNVAGFAITGGAVGNLTISESSINNTSGGGFNVSTSGTLNVTLDSLSSAGGVNGINLIGSTGSFSANGGAISGSTGTAFNVNGGTANITYAGTISKDTGTIVSVSNTTGGSKTLSGAITDGNDGDGNGISLTNNTGGTINFQGGLLLSTGANPAFTATGGGTVNVCDDNPCNPAATGTLVNTLTTTTGTALNVANTNIGANKLEFRSISANGAANGIVLNNTGASGGLTVTGTGTTAGSGGTIQNSTGTGILLASTRNVVLNRMNITGSADDGIGGSNVNGFVLDSCSITGNGNTTNADSGIDITNLTGTASGGTNPTRIVNNTISNSFLYEIGITNTNAGTLTDLQMSGNTLSSNGLQPNHGNLMTLQALGNDTITLNVTSGSFTGNTDTTGGRIVTASGLICDHSGSNGTITCNVSGATFTTNNVGLEATIASNSSGTRNTVFDFNNNNIQRSRAIATNFFADANPPFTKSIRGRPRNNTIGTAGTVGSAASVGFPVRVQNEGRIPVTMAVTGNTIRESLGFTAINVNHGITITSGTDATNMTITDNIVNKVDSGRGVLVQQVDMTTANQNAGTLCADIRSNSFTNIAGQGGDGTIIRVRESSNTDVGPHNVTQLSPTAAANANELDDANGVTAAQVSLSGTPTFGAGACTQP